MAVLYAPQHRAPYRLRQHLTTLVAGFGARSCVLCDIALLQQRTILPILTYLLFAGLLEKEGHTKNH